MKRWLPVLIALAHFVALSFLAQQHPFGNFATETDFYHYYAPDAERIASGEFPQNTYQGPGYPALLALIAKLSGTSGDLFSAGKWLSVVCAVICGWLVFLLFGRLFDYWVGIGAQLVAIVSGEFPQFSINAATDIFFLMLCLAVLVVFLGKSSDKVGADLRVCPEAAGDERQKQPRGRAAPFGRIALAGALTGFAYVTRYNGVFLLLTCVLVIMLINYFDQDWRDRIGLSVVFIAVFVLVSSPWLIANYLHRGSPFYNTNYLNIATEYFPELVGGETNQDATRALSVKFHSFRDVWRYDPNRLITQYPINLYKSLRMTFTSTLVNSFVAWLAWLGMLFAIGRQRSKAIIVVLVTTSIYMLLISLTHWETRYYFFLVAVYAGFAVYAVSSWLNLAREAGWMKRPVFSVIPTALVMTMFLFSFAESREDVTQFLSSQPNEILAARDYLSSIGAAGGKRILARKPHLPYLSRNEWVFFPQVKSLDEFRLWIENNRVDYIAIGRRELKERKELKLLGNPRKAPEWLKPVWANEDPMFILYKPELKQE